jgi:hypothetical protein
MTSQIFNVVVVLVSLYVALSIACSFLQEHIAALLNMRGDVLAKGLGQLVAGDEAMLKDLSTHPLVADAPADGSKQSKRSLLSYVDPRNLV